MWNTLVSACVHMRVWMCVCRSDRARGGEQEKGKEREENLGQTWSETHLKWWRKCVQPLRNQYEGSGKCSQPMTRQCGRKWVVLWKYVSYIMKPLPDGRPRRLQGDCTTAVFIQCLHWRLPRARPDNTKKHTLQPVCAGIILLSHQLGLQGCFHHQEGKHTHSLTSSFLHKFKRKQVVWTFMPLDSLHKNKLCFIQLTSVH